MEIEFKIDIDLFEKALREKSKVIATKFPKSAFRSAQNFITLIVKRWLTGRYATDEGLNRQSGTYARSWSAKVQGSDEAGLIASVRSNVKYGVYHEPSPEGWTKERKMPVRTHITENWNDEGLIMFVNAWNKILMEEFK